MLTACAQSPDAGTASPTLQDPVAPGFEARPVLAGLDRPTAIRFGPDGRAWIAEQAGRVKVFDGLDGGQPTLSADLSANVAGRNNRGLLGLAPDPTDANAAYVLYTFPAPPGVDAPTWNDDATNCPDGSTRSCVSTGILSRVAFDADGVATETVLARGWCHHHASHAPNDLQIAPDGALLVSAGEGSVPELPLDDGTWLPAAQRCNDGAFSSRAAPDERAPGEWTGAIVRFEAADLHQVVEGAQSREWLAERADVVAYGLRNPFRMTVRPGTSELWIGDPGWEDWEEIDVVMDTSGAAAADFGWPCREGPDPAPNYSADARCAALTADPSRAVAPWWFGRAGQPLGQSEGCSPDTAAMSGIAFGAPDWPAPFANTLFFADSARQCVFAFEAPAGAPDPDSVDVFWRGAGTIVDLTRGPDGALYAADFGAGTISRLAPAR